MTQKFVLPPPPAPSVEISGTTERFPVRRIFCVGRNYAEHAREFGNDPDREPPFFFAKPADTIVDDGATIPYPPQTENLHHEAELVVALMGGGQDIDAGNALALVYGYGAGNDLTRRDLQSEAKGMGRPWDLAKGFDNSCVVGPLQPVKTIAHPARGTITAHVNGTLRQTGDLADMIWPVADVISFLSRSVELCPGDLIMTGTPAGVGPLVRGDECVVSVEGVGEVTTRIAP